MGYKPTATAKGNRTDGDILMKNTNETFTLGEVKLTKETRLTTGQRRAKKHIEESNGKFEVKRDIPQFGISKNQVIKITNFEKITKYE